MNAVKNNRTRNLLLAGALVLVVAAAFGLRFKVIGQETEVASIRDTQARHGLPVETVAVVRGDLSRWISLAGTVEGIVQYPVVSNNALRVVGIPVTDGDAVKKGDVIIHLSSGAPSPMFHSLDKARASYADALLNAQRLRNLYEAGAVSKSELDAAETNLKVQAAGLQDAEGSTTLTASEDGVVSSILVKIGETVKAGAPLAWVTDTSDVKVVFSAGSNQALSLKVGQPARLTAPDGSRRDGSLVQLDLMADPSTHLLDGKVRFANVDGLLLPGLLVSFEVRTHQRDGVLVLPRACVVATDDGSAVWVAGRTASLVPVETGLETVDRVEIVAGLQEGQAVVRHGQTLLSEGVGLNVVATGEDH